MRIPTPIRKEATCDGVWTVFVGPHLCFSDLSEPDADALVAAFACLAEAGGWDRGRLISRSGPAIPA